MRIDLHTHSRLSDGTDSPSELVHTARAVGLDVVAVTDHDIVDGWQEAGDAAADVGIRLVPGIEWSVTDGEHGRHLLAYGFDPVHPEIVEMIRHAKGSRSNRAEAVIARLQDLGYPLDRDAVFAMVTDDGEPSRVHIADELLRVATGRIDSRDQAFAELLNPGRPGYVERYRPDIEDAIATVRRAGGVSVFAHPRDTARGPGATDERIAELGAAGLAGIEVDHQKHDAATREALRRLADDLGLVATGSSDYHGTRKVDHDLGCNLTSPEAAERLLGVSF